MSLLKHKLTTRSHDRLIIKVDSRPKDRLEIGRQITDRKTAYLQKGRFRPERNCQTWKIDRYISIRIIILIRLATLIGVPDGLTKSEGIIIRCWENTDNQYDTIVMLCPILDITISLDYRPRRG